MTWIIADGETISGSVLIWREDMPTEEQAERGFYVANFKQARKLCDYLNKIEGLMERLYEEVETARLTTVVTVADNRRVIGSIWDYLMNDWRPAYEAFRKAAQ